MPNVYARAAALSNVSGRIDYIANPERQEHLICTYNSADELQFWIDLAAHCQQSAAEAGHDKACEAREWHAALPNHYALMYQDREEVLAQEISELVKNITGTENYVAIHWNKSMTNFHCHIICSENKEVNEISYGAVLTRNTYYNADGKRSTKKDCLDEAGNLKKGCTFYRKGERLQKIKRFGTKEYLRDHEVTEKIKHALADKYNKDLDTLQYQVYKEDGMHIKTQKVGKNKPEKMRKKIEYRNQCVISYNNAVDAFLQAACALSEEDYAAAIAEIKDIRNFIKKYGNTKEWLHAIENQTSRLESETEYLQKMNSQTNEEELQEDIPEKQNSDNQDPNDQDEKMQTVEEIKQDSDILEEALDELQRARAELDDLNRQLAACRFWEGEKKRMLREEIKTVSERCDAAFKLAVSFGCSPFQDGVEMTATTVDMDGFLFFSEHIIAKLQAKEKVSDKEFISSRIAASKEKAENKTMDRTKNIEYER